MGNLGLTEILIIVGVVVLLFGATKLPKLARSLGESARIFKAETKGMRQDEQSTGSGEKTESGDSGSTARASERQLSESKQPQEPLEAETVDEQQHKRAS